MKYLLDTNVIIAHLRKAKFLSAETINAGCAISIITYAELLQGAYRSKNPKVGVKIVEEFLEDLGITVLPLSLDVIHEYARQEVTLAQQGNRLDSFDLLIAATAITHELGLVTKNLRHFVRLSENGLKIQT